jgi:hypothetical protein
MSVIGIGIGVFRKHGRAVAAKQLEAINATQDFLLSEPVDFEIFQNIWTKMESVAGSRNLLQTNR